MAAEWTLLKVLRWTSNYLQEKGIDNPRFDAEMLLGHALHKDRVALYLCYDQPLQSDELTLIRQLVARRAAREPLQYILGQTEFWSLPFTVKPGVLIPRADTEVLVEEAVRLLHSGEVSGDVLDVGTGSGAIAVAIAHDCSVVNVTAVDISNEALDIARGNAGNNGVEERIEFICADMAELGRAGGERYALVVSNPPYITAADMVTLMPEVRDHEPELALAAGADGLDYYRLLCSAAETILLDGGCLLVEVGAGQSDDVADLMEQSGLQRIFRRCDYAGIERVVGGFATAGSKCN